MGTKTKHRIWKKIVLAVAILGVLCGGFILATNLWIKHSVSSYIIESKNLVTFYENQSQNIQSDCILVLGAGVYKNNEPSPILKERLDRAILLYDQKVSDKIIVSGDHNKESYDEVNVMKSYLKQAGIPDDAIFMDHAGLNTYDSMYRARFIFQVERPVIVTQKYHLYRSVYLARALGMDAYGVACDQQIFSGTLARESRELLARTKDFVNAICQPQARIMGDAIPVSGNGSQTNDKN